MSDAILDSINKMGAGTGQERLELRRPEAGGTVSLLLREHREVFGTLGMVGCFGGATTPAESYASERLTMPITVHVVVDAERTRQAPVELGVLAANARVLTTLTLTFTGLTSTLPAQAEGTAAETAAPSAQSDVRRSVEPSDAETMRALASRLAAEAPAVEVTPPQVPHLTDNLVDNARRLFGLTVAQLASLLGVTERQVYRLDPVRMPSDRRSRLDALVAVGLILAGGLGPDGARGWMDSGGPSGWELLRAGDTGELRVRAEELRDSVAT